MQRNDRQGESINVAGRTFVEGGRADLGSRDRHRGIDDVDDASPLREPGGPYTLIFATQIVPPR